MMVPRTFVVPYVHTVDSCTTCTFEDKITIGLLCRSQNSKPDALVGCGRELVMVDGHDTSNDLTNSDEWRG